MESRDGRRVVRSAGAMLVVAALGVSSGAFGLAGRATGEPVPSAGEVARGKQQVRDRAVEVGRLKAQLATADGELEELAIRAETAVERYNGELVMLDRARQEQQAAEDRLAEAERRYETIRTELAGFAATAYRTEGGTGSWAGMITGRGGPQNAMDRAGLVEMMERHRTGALQKTRAARDVADVFRGRATAAFRGQQDALQRAEAAKRAAEEAVDRQHASMTRLNEDKERAERLLSAAEAQARRLEGKRREALETRLRGSSVTKLSRRRSLGAGRGTSALLQGSSRAAVVVQSALRWLGTPYSWGGGNANGPSYGIGRGRGTKGFDCSGLALHAWAKVGVRLDHWTGTQWTSGPHIPLNMLRPGDLVFFARDTRNPDTIHHVGIYVGRGQMVEAPYTGARVRISSIWRRGLIGATRPAA
ncbi:NlpC/P60 family protein [Thermomonospora echinospora]|uniref:NlpC/P60 family protein n=1 Tax=Thermomonospora echinospora TaxID=1992 RepID=UPI001F38416D|nr:NlpC/P60 family protein [Thermomonospora echinospora]